MGGDEIERLKDAVERLKELGGRSAEGPRLFGARADARLERLDKALAELAEQMNALTRRTNSLTQVVEGHITDEARHQRSPG